MTSSTSSRVQPVRQLQRSDRQLYSPAPPNCLTARNQRRGAMLTARARVSVISTLSPSRTPLSSDLSLTA